MQFLDLKKQFKWLHNEHVKLCMLSEKQLDVLCSILLPLKRLRGKTLSILWQDTVEHTITTCRCTFGNSNMKQTRDFPKDKGNSYRDSLKKQTKLLKISEKMR